MQYSITISGRQTGVGTYSESVSASQLNMVLTIDKTLDYGSFVVRNQRPEPYEVGDMVDIDITDGVDTKSYHFIVSADDVTQLPNGYFIHAINIIELTKILEWQSESNRSFTARIDGRISLLDVVIALQSTLPLRPTSEIETTRVFSIDVDLRGRLSDTDSPDFQFTNRNLKEMLFEVFDFIGAIPRLIKVSNNLVLTADFYNERGSLVEPDAFYRMKRLDINEYSTALDSDIKNMFDDYTTITEPSNDQFKPLASNTELVKEDNAIIDTEYPIVEIESFKALIGETELDLTEYIVEKELFDQLQNLKFGDVITNGNFRDNTLFFTRYQKNIGGLYEQAGFLNNQNRIDVVLRRALIDSGQTAVVQLDFRDLRFQITYKALLDSRSEVKRIDTKNIKYDSQVYTGQPGNLVRADRALDRLFKLQQLLGNASIMTSERITALDDLYELGDFKDDDYIITTIEMVCEKKHILTKYMWSQNYQKVSEFVDVNSEVRLYDIPVRTFKRNFYVDNFIEIDLEGKPNTSFVTPAGIQTFANTIAPVPSAVHNTPVGLFVFNNDDAKGFDTETETLIKPQTAFAGGNSINFHAEFDNPKIAGFQYDDSRGNDEVSEIEELGDQLDQDPSLLSQIAGSVGDLFSGFVSGTINAIRENIKPFRQPPSRVGINYSNDFGEILDFGFQFAQEADYDQADSVFLPVVDKTEIVRPLITAPKHRAYKDARENLALTYSLHVLPTVELQNRIVVGKYLIERNNLLKTISTAPNQFEVFTSDRPYSVTENAFSRSTDTIASQTYSVVPYEVSSVTSGFVVSISQAIAKEVTWGIRKKNTRELVFVVNPGDVPIGVNSPPSNRALWFTFRSKQSFVQYPNQTFVAPLFVLRPTSFQVLVAPQDTQIAVSWVDPNSPSADDYEVEVSSNLKTWTTFTPSITSQTFTGLTPNTFYTFRVRARIGDRFSEYTYLTATTDVPAPDKVMNLVVSEFQPLSIFLKWDEVPGAFGYFINISENSNFSPLLAEGGLQRSNNNFYQINVLNTPGLESNKQYFFRVRAIRAEQAGPNSDTVSITTNPLRVTSPPIITNIKINFNQITFTLVNTDDSIVVTLFADLSTGTTQRATGVRPNEARTFTLTAVTGNTNVLASAKAALKDTSPIVTLPFVATEAPATPNLPVGALSQTVNNHVKVDFTYSGPIVNGFVLERKPNAELANAFGTVREFIGPSERTVTDFFAPASTTLEYRIKAVNQFDTTVSNTRSITTGTFAPATPSGLSANVVLDGLGNAAVTLSWQRNSTDESLFYIYRGNLLAGTATRGSTNFTDFVLENETHIYSVSAGNEFGISAKSTGLTVNT